MIVNEFIIDVKQHFKRKKEAKHFFAIKKVFTKNIFLSHRFMLISKYETRCHLYFIKKGF